METSYDKAALQEYVSDINAVGELMRRTSNESHAQYDSCKQQYTRLYTELEQKLRRAVNMVDSAESLHRTAETEYNLAIRILENSEDETERNSARQKLAYSQTLLAEAEAEMTTASAAYTKAQADMRRLTNVWERHQSKLDVDAQHAEEGLAAFFSIVNNENSALNEYIDAMGKYYAVLFTGSPEASTSIALKTNSGNILGRLTTAGATSIVMTLSGQTHRFPDTPTGSEMAYKTALKSKDPEMIQKTKELLSNSFNSVSSAGNASVKENVDEANFVGSAPIGWCAHNSMTAVSINEFGQKTVSMTIGGSESNYPCTKLGVEKAYRHAKASGDQDMIVRTSAMFEIETIREDLELGNGESGFAQIGGYHKDVKKQDPIGYESHHIPSQGVQDEDGEMLPTISITYDDHKLTSSFAGKQRRTYQPVFPTELPLSTYKESVIQNLERGSSGYVESIKHELLDLRNSTGHRYDGGISAYLDAVIDMLATRGVPKAKSGYAD